jgi:hypothetical protein
MSKNNNNLIFGPMENLENPTNYRPTLYKSKNNTRKNAKKNARKNTKRNNNTPSSKYNKYKNMLRNKPKGPPFASMTPKELKELENAMKHFNYM